MNNMGLLSRNIIGLFLSQNIESHKFVQKAFHLGCAALAVDKSSLAQLRKETGFSISNCKKALELHEGDINLSKEWLNKEAQKQGWAKATKLMGRVTTQGLVGFHIENGVASLIEVNCETDFVARNQEFQDLVSNIAKEVTLVNTSTNLITKKEMFSKEQIENLRTTEGKTLLDTVALAIGKIGENMQISRAATLSINSPGTQLIGYTHPSSSTNPSVVGTYGAIVAFKNLSDNVSLARDLCAHIIGRNPSAIGSLDDVEDEVISPVHPVPPAEKNSADSEEDDFVEEAPHDFEDNTILVKQKFVTNDELTVGQVLKENGIEITDFIRFQVGELSQNT